MKTVLKAIMPLFVILVLSAYSIVVSASECKTFRVYKNNGSLEVFFYSVIDSITVSTDEYGLVQNFHTTDSIISIPVAEIDSVCFTKIPTIYKAGAVNLDDKLRKYIIGGNDSTLFLSSVTPLNLLPHVGDNMAALKCDEILPYGFIGKVENIDGGGDTIKLNCSKVSVVDIFESLSIEADVTSSLEQSRKSRAVFDNNLTIPSIRGDIDLSNEIKIGESFSNDYSMRGRFDLATDSCHVRFTFILTPKPFQLPGVYFSYLETLFRHLTVGGSFASSYNWSKDIEIQGLNHIPIPGIPKIIELFEEVGVYIDFTGEVGIEGSYTLPYNTVTHFTHDSDNEVVIPPTFQIIPHEPITETNLEGSATIGMGLYGKIGVAPVDKRAATIETALRFGVDFSSSISLATATPSIETINTEFYDDINRDDFYRADLSAKIELSATAFGNKKISGNISFGDLLLKNPLLTWGCVPSFSEVKLVNDKSSIALNASANLGRRLLPKVKVGFGIYDSKNKLVEAWWHPNNYRNPDDIITLSHKFEKVSAGNEYTVHPIVKLNKIEMAANPTAKATIESKMYTVTNTSNSWGKEGGAPCYSGSYELKIDIDKDEIIRVMSKKYIHNENPNDNMPKAESGWQPKLGEIRGFNDDESDVLNSINNTISFYYIGRKIDRFDKEDYENWVAKSDDSFVIFYQSSKDNYETTHRLEVKFEVIYNQKPEIGKCRLEPEYPTSIIESKLIIPINGAYWVESCDYESICLTDSEYNYYHRDDQIRDRDFSELARWITVWNVGGNVSRRYSDKFTFNLKDGNKISRSISYTLTYVQSETEFLYSYYSNIVSD